MASSPLVLQIGSNCGVGRKYLGSRYKTIDGILPKMKGNRAREPKEPATSPRTVSSRGETFPLSSCGALKIRNNQSTVDGQYSSPSVQAQAVDLGGSGDGTPAPAKRKQML